MKTFVTEHDYRVYTTHIDIIKRLAAQAMKMLVLQIEIRIIPYRSTPFNCLQETGAHEFFKGIINRSTR